MDLARQAIDRHGPRCPSCGGSPVGRRSSTEPPPAIRRTSRELAEIREVHLFFFPLRSHGCAPARSDGAAIGRGTHDPVEELTERELEVLGLMAEGRSNKAVADRLFITEHTVEKHVQNIFAKLQIPATTDDHRRVLAVLTFLNSS